MPTPERDGMGLVVKSLLFAALVLVSVGVVLLLTGEEPMIGALLAGAGLIDGAMALVLRQRG